MYTDEAAAPEKMRPTCYFVVIKEIYAYTNLRRRINFVQIFATPNKN